MGRKEKWGLLRFIGGVKTEKDGVHWRCFSEWYHMRVDCEVGRIQETSQDAELARLRPRKSVFGLF